jgi:hypothetical protein
MRMSLLPLRLVVFAGWGVAVAFVAGRATAQDSAVSVAPGTGELQVRLEARDGQTSFKLGDTIRLELIFSHPGFGSLPPLPPRTPMEIAQGVRRPGEHTVNTTDYGDLADKVNITPASGVFQWQGPSAHDYFSAEPLTDHELRVSLVLNQGYTFHDPGHYEVSVTTYRLDGQPFTTGPLGLDIAGRSDEEELALVRNLDAQIAGSTGRQRAAPARQLAALTGDDAVRAKVGWLLAETDDEDDPVPRAMAEGLAASRNYDLQLELLEAGWHDVHQIPDGELLGAMDSTRRYKLRMTEPGWQMMGAAEPRDPTDPTLKQLADERRADVQAIVDSLPQRSGKNLTETTEFLIGKVDPSQSDMLHRLVVSEFAHMPLFTQGVLIQNQYNWAWMRDPGLIPALRTMLDNPRDDIVGYADPLERLIDLDPATAKPYVIREICDPKSDVPMKQMAAMPEATLPETDACLLQQMTESASKKAVPGLAWPEKAVIASRFASAAIYPQMLALYRAHPEWQDSELRGALIAYLVRWHPETAAALLPAASLGSEGEVVDEVTEMIKARHGSYPEALHLALRDELAHGPVSDAEQALRNLSQLGNQEDAAVGVARLDRVVAEWRGREAELTAEKATTAALDARDFRMGLVNQLWSKESVWKLPEAERQRVKRLCLGDQCAREGWNGEGWP